MRACVRVCFRVIFPSEKQKRGTSYEEQRRCAGAVIRAHLVYDIEGRSRCSRVVRVVEMWCIMRVVCRTMCGCGAGLKSPLRDGPESVERLLAPRVTVI